MKKLLVLFSILLGQEAHAAGPSPCYWSGTYVKCFPTAGISGVDGTVSLPAYTFTTDPDSGLYRIGANDLGIAVNGAVSLEVTTSGVKTASVTWTDTTKGIVGTATNNNAAASYVGEYIENKVTASTNTGSSAQYFDAGSITLTAGDWDINGSIFFTPNTGVYTSVDLICGISGATGNSATGLSPGVTYGEFVSSVVTSYSAISVIFGPVRVQSDGTNIYINGTTTSTSQIVYLKGYPGSFSSGQPQYKSLLRARRIR